MFFIISGLILPVRYILKTDDDMYVNVPNLVQNLKNRSKVHDSTKGQEKEYMLIGDLICGARPVQDVSNKWLDMCYYLFEACVSVSRIQVLYF